MSNIEGSYRSDKRDTDVVYNMYAMDPASIVEAALAGDEEPEELRGVDLTGRDLGQDDPMLDAQRNRAHPLRP